MFEAGLYYAHKHIGSPKYEDFSIPIGAAASTGLFDWVAGSWGATPEARNGAVLGVDMNFNIKSEVAFSGALVVETEIPALDAASSSSGGCRESPEISAGNESDQRSSCPLRCRAFT